MDDLISREAALDAIDGMKPMRGNMEQLAMKSLCWAAVKTIQPVDAVPVMHGLWKSVKASVSDNYPFWNSKCSVCGYTTAMTQDGWLYCPHCGAKMDGERRDEDGTIS